MYFPSDSWGKLGKAFEMYMKDGVDYVPLGDMQELTAIANEVFKASGFERLSRLEILKKVLEGLRMPVHNPKTGEQDFVDVSLVNKIVVDSEYVEDMISNNKIKIDITLSGNKEQQEVGVIASNKELQVAENHILPLQTFEEMLFKAINEVKDQRLEEVDEFRAVVNNLVAVVVSNGKAKGKYLARIGEEYELLQGIGIIRDIKTNQDIGTFESFEYMYDKNRRLVNMEGVILSGRTFEDLEEKDRFEFAFYSLENELVYSLIASERAAIRTDANGQAVDIEKYDLLIDVFQEGHKYFSVATVAQEKKALMEGIDQSHPLYDSNHEQFRQSRLDILEESKSRQKQEKLVSQFADIEMDF